jgi:hypothetical protein
VILTIDYLFPARIVITTGLSPNSKNKNQSMSMHQGNLLVSTCGERKNQAISDFKKNFCWTTKRGNWKNKIENSMHN